MIIDAHIHIVGNGTGGTGCWLRPPGLGLPMAAWMLKHVGLPFHALKGDMDRLYVERLLELIRESSLDHAVILGQDYPHDESGNKMQQRAAFYVPNDYILQLAKTHPEFLPAVSIHPARADAMEELEKCLEGGALVLKILPNCHNIDCNLPRYRKFWERMAETGLLLLAHTGGEHTLPQTRPELADPRTLRLPLECGVTCIAAHSGTKSGFTDPEYFFILAGMMRRYPNLYGDISAFNIPIRSRRFRDSLKEPVLSRMIHGSDYPVLIYGHWAWMRGLVDWHTFRKWQRHPNVLERDYQLKRAMGFPNEVFSRVGTLFRKRI